MAHPPSSLALLWCIIKRPSAHTCSSHLHWLASILSKQSYKHKYLYASWLCCFIHCRQNIKQQLKDQHYPEGKIKTVLNDVFGVQQDDVFAEGLVDYKYDVDFSDKLQVLEERLNSIEESSSQISRGFYNWFVRHKSDVIKSTMLRTVREEVGLGCPS